MKDLRGVLSTPVIVAISIVVNHEPVAYATVPSGNVENQNLTIQLQGFDEDQNDNVSISIFFNVFFCEFLQFDLGNIYISSLPTQGQLLQTDGTPVSNGSKVSDPSGFLLYLNS